MHSGDQPSNIEQWMRRMEAQQQQLDSRVRGAGLLYAAGDQTVVTNGSGQVAIPFGITFNEAPVVIVRAALSYRVDLGAVSTSGFIVTFSAADGSGPLVSTSLRALWHALPATT